MVAVAVQQMSFTALFWATGVEAAVQAVILALNRR